MEGESPLTRNTHPRNCLRVGYYVSPCECKATIDYVAQLVIGFGMRIESINLSIYRVVRIF